MISSRAIFSGLLLCGAIIILALAEAETWLAPARGLTLVSEERQLNNTRSICPKEFETDYNLWPNLVACCRSGNIAHNRATCCPHPMIPGTEPNADPALYYGTCCNTTDKICCRQDLAGNVLIGSEHGLCCRRDGSGLRGCCPPPLFPTKSKNPITMSGYEYQCCFDRNNICCDVSVDHLRLWPSPRCCSPRGFCCPWPYLPAFYKRHGRPPDPQYDDLCYAPGRANYPPSSQCRLPLVPNYRSCIEQSHVITDFGKDNPEYSLSFPRFSNRDPARTITFAQPQCKRQEIVRDVFGNPYYKSAGAGSSVPLYWFVTRPQTVRMKVLNVTTVTAPDGQQQLWPQVIIPFIFPLTIMGMPLLEIIPLFILSGLLWALSCSLRFLAHKKIRMAIRWLLIRLEKGRRNFRFRTVPPRDLRKVRERERYQMPKMFQDSDLSSDDEPEELAGDEYATMNADHYHESLWTQEEIDRLGFDPDHIPLEWIYGDLIGKPEAVKPEVRRANLERRNQMNQRKPGANDVDSASLDSEEWRDFLQNKIKDKDKRDEGVHMNSVRQGLRKMRERVNPSAFDQAPPTSSSNSSRKLRKTKTGIVASKKKR